MTDFGSKRPVLVRRGLILNYLTIGYNVVEALVSIAAGLAAGSVALVGFGIDSAIEVTASGAAHWRLRVDHHEAGRTGAERRTRQVIGGCFLALALYVGVEASSALWSREVPGRSVAGLVILTASLIVMPWLARRKRAVARALVGVGLNALLGWWWADPAAALAMTPIIMREGLVVLRAG